MGSIIKKCSQCNEMFRSKSDNPMCNVCSPRSLPGSRELIYDNGICRFKIQLVWEQDYWVNFNGYDEYHKTPDGPELYESGFMKYDGCFETHESQHYCSPNDVYYHVDLLKYVYTSVKEIMNWTGMEEWPE